MKHLALFVLSSALLLMACESDNRSCIGLPGGGEYCLIDGPWPDYSTEQASNVTIKGRPLHMISRISSGAEGLRFAGLSPLGQTLLEVSWENSTLNSKVPSALSDRFNPLLIPAILQIATWPAEQVRQGLSPGLELVEQSTEKAGQRIIRNDRGDVLIVFREGEQLPYQRLRIEVPAMNLIMDSRLLEEMP